MKELEAVNYVLQQVNERPVTTLDSVTPSVTRIQEDMKTSKNSLLATGWWFNQSVITLLPDNEGKIATPINVLAVYSLDGTNVAIHSEYLYNINNDSYMFDGGVRVRLIKDIAFDDLPEYAQQYIMYSATISLYTSDFGTDNNIQHYRDRAYTTKQMLDRENLRNRRYNSSRVPNWGRHLPDGLLGGLY